jgi:hypothetical protein
VSDDIHLHAAICGQTGTGKTYLAQRLAIEFRQLGKGVIVLHKPREPWSGVNWQTDNPELFIRKFWRCQHVIAFMEFADARVEKMDTRFHDCFSQGRHNGIRCFFLSQRAAQVHPTIRENCSGLYLFGCGAKGAAVWAEEMCDDELLAAATLPPRQFYYKPNRFEPAKPRILTK